MAVRFFGTPTGVTGWSYDEDAVSTDRGESPSGTATVTVNGAGRFNPADLTPLLGKTLVVQSTDHGRSDMMITDISIDDDAWSITGGSGLAVLNQVGTLNPLHRTDLNTVLLRAYQAVRSDMPSLDVDERLKDERYNMPGGRDNVWAMIRRFLSANALDLFWADNRIRLAPRPGRTLYLQDRTASSTVNLEDGARSKEIRVNVYHRTRIGPETGVNADRGLIYPVAPSRYPGADTTYGDSENTSVMTVGAGERAVATIRFGAEVTYVSQPAIVKRIPFKDGSPDFKAMRNGLYVVVGKDNKPIMPAQWKDMGGGLRVLLNPDRRSADVVFSGMNYEHLAPYRLCESDGKTDHPALYLIGGYGSYVDIETLVLHTGAKGTDDITTIDNPAIDTRAKGWAAAQAAAQARVGSTLTLQWSGAPPSDEQLFGVIVGSRFRLKGHWWRVESASISDSGLSLRAASHPLLADYNRIHPRVADLPIAGRTLRDLSTIGVL